MIHSNGEWVPKYPSHTETRGYHLSGLVSVLQTADKIMFTHQRARTTPQKLRVYNSILGFPYAGDLQPITDKVLDICERNYGFKSKGNYTFMGVDQGDVLHITILKFVEI